MAGRWMVTLGVWLAISGLAASGLALAAGPDVGPRAAEETLRGLRVRAGMRVEIVAAEPLVVDPVAFDWGPDGRLWVVEMHDYPLGLDGKWKPGGRIKFLEDTNGDGKLDKATVFLDGVSIPNGVLPWRDGVLVTAAPEIFFAADRNGDGRADERKTLYRGFRPGNPQLRINGLRYGLDDWIYCANGWSGGQVESLVTGQKLSIEGRDVRLRPDRGELDPQSGVSQFGRNRDDWNQWFGQNNSYPLWHFVLEDHYTRRNPHVPPGDPMRQLVLPANPKVYPASRQEKRFHSFEHSGHYTSACSAMIYRDVLLFDDPPSDKSPSDKPPSDKSAVRHAFTCEPFHNLVQHHVVEEDGVTFRARRDPAEREFDFLASDDRWCRPVMARTGPDGVLWVADMYRYMIEHPEYLTPEGRTELAPHYRLGDDRGRIYRIVPAGRPPRAIPRFDRLSPAELVQALESPSGWQRDMVQMMLVWRGDKAVAPRLEKLARESPQPLARVHALATLAALESLSPAMLTAALRDNHPGVRRQALRWAESRTSDANVTAAVLRLVDDPAAKVRLQVASSLGAWTDRAAAATLGKLALRDGQEPFLAAAVVSSLRGENVAEVLAGLFAGTSPPPGELVSPVAVTAIALGKTEAVVAGAAAVVAPRGGRYEPWQLTAMTGLLDALARGKLPLATLTEGRFPRRPTTEQFDALLAFARQTADDPAAAVDLRSRAIRLVGHRHRVQEADLAQLAALLVPQTPGDVQRAAVEALSRTGHPQTPYRLAERWTSHSPALQGQILDVLLSREAWCEALLTLIAERKIAATDLDVTRRQRLVEHRQEAIRNLAKKVLASATTSDRKEVLERYRPALTQSGTAARGRELFLKRCASCHQLAGQGHAVGPDLKSLTDKSPQALLTAILDPNQSLELKFRSFTALINDGRTVTGVVQSETATSITLVAQDGQQHRLLRTDLEDFRTGGKSLMPEGLESEVTIRDMADLISFLREALGSK